jgi:phage-related protein (TIGR01555 family)
MAKTKAAHKSTTKAVVAADRKIQQRRVDGWNNFFTGVGHASVDRRLHTSYGPDATVPEQVLSYLFRGDGLARKIVEKPAKAMCRGGFGVKGDPEGMVRARLEETGIFAARQKLVKWARLYGGAVGVLGIQDGGKYTDAVKTDKIRNLHFMHVFSRWRVICGFQDMYKDPAHPKFGTPEFYTIIPITGNQFRVHESRVIRVDGADADEITRQSNQGWGDSFLQSCFKALRSLGSVYDSSESIIEDFVQATISIKGLSELIGNNQEAKAIKRLEILDKSRHTINAVMLDADLETYSKISSSVAGLSDLLDRHAGYLAGVSGIPVTILMGEAPAGLNATGDADVRNWYDELVSERDDMIGQSDQRLAKLVFLSRDYHFKGKEPDNWKIEYPPMWEPSAKEQVEIKKLRAETITSLVTNGILDPEEARRMPEIADEYCVEGELDERIPTEPEADPDDESESTADDAVEKRRTIMEAARSRIVDKLMRRRADSNQYDVLALYFPKEKFPMRKDAEDWANDNGFLIGRVRETTAAFHIDQGTGAGSVPDSQKSVVLDSGVTLIMVRMRKNA